METRGEEGFSNSALLWVSFFFFFTIIHSTFPVDNYYNININYLICKFCTNKQPSPVCSITAGHGCNVVSLLRCTSSQERMKAVRFTSVLCNNNMFLKGICMLANVRIWAICSFFTINKLKFVFLFCAGLRFSIRNKETTGTKGCC